MEERDWRVIGLAALTVLGAGTVMLLLRWAVGEAAAYVIFGLACVVYVIWETSRQRAILKARYERLNR